MALIWLFNSERHLITRNLFKQLKNKYSAYLSCNSSSRLLYQHQLIKQKEENNQSGYLNFKNSLKLNDAPQNKPDNKPDNKPNFEKLFKFPR
jgi:hypothetical protein